MNSFKALLFLKHTGSSAVAVAIGLSSVLATMSYFRNLAGVRAIREMVTVMDTQEGFYGGEVIATHTYESGKSALALAAKSKLMAIPEGTVRRGVAGGDGNLFKAIRFDADTKALSFCGAIHFAQSKNDRETCVVVPPADAHLFANGSEANLTTPSGTVSTLSWTSTGAASCQLTGGVPCTGPTPPAACNLTNNAGLSTGPLTATQTYELTCNSSLNYPPAAVTKQLTITIDVPTCAGFFYDNSCFYKSNSPATSGGETCNQLCASHGGPAPRLGNAAVCQAVVFHFVGGPGVQPWWPAPGPISAMAPFTAGVCGIHAYQRLVNIAQFATVMPNYNLPVNYGNAQYYCVCNN